MKPALALSICAFSFALAACGGSEADWTKAKTTNTPAAYRDYLAQYPQGAHTDDANAAIDNLDWTQAQKTDSIEGYEAYLNSHPHPKGLHANDAKNLSAALRDDHDWIAAKTANTPDALGTYLKVHPSGKHAADAADLRARLDDDAAWKYAQATNTSSAFESYLARFPSGQYATDAKAAVEDSAWHTAQSANTLPALRRYLSTYPAGKFATQAGDAIDALDWQAAKTANTLPAWKNYLAQHKTGRYTADALTLAEDAEWNLALKSATAAPFVAFIRDYPQSRRLDQARSLLLALADSQDWQAAQQADTPQAYLAFYKAHPNSSHLTVLTGTLKAQAMVIKLEYGGQVLETSLTPSAGTAHTLYISLQDGRRLGLLAGINGTDTGVFAIAGTPSLDNATLFLHQTDQGPQILAVFSPPLDNPPHSWRLSPPKGL